MANKYHINSSVRVWAKFYADDELADPTVVTLKIMNPDGDITTYTYPADITKESTGVYYKEIPSNSSGDWHYEWTGTGSWQAADENLYLIDHSKFS